MSGVHTIYLNGGDQPLVHVAPVPGIVSCSYVVEDLSVSDTSALRVLATGSAAVDSLSEVTVGSVAGPRSATPRRLPIVASTAVAGRAYRLVSSDDGTSELVRVEAVTATSVTLSGRLSATYPVGSALVGAELRAAFPGDAAAREELQEEDRVLRVLWSYAIGGVTLPLSEQIRVVKSRTELAAWVSGVELRLRADWPEPVNLLGGSPGTLRGMVQSCASDMAAGLRAMSLEPDALFLGDQGFELLIRRCVYRFGELGHVPKGRDPEAWVSQAKAHWLSLYKAVSNGGGARTAEIEGSTDAAKGSRRGRRRTLIRSA